ncbi:hypothetical protein [Clostridium sp. DL1XJH146]
MKKIIFLFVALIIVVGSIIVCSVIDQEKIIARYVTDEHYRYSPVELKGEIYFPFSYEFSDYKNLNNIGHLSAKNAGFINDLIGDVGPVLVEKEDNDYLHFTVIDDFPMSYSSAEYLRDPNLIKDNMDKYNEFVLCNDKNNTETRIKIEKEFLNKLQKEFGVINYNIEDFNNCDDIYYIYVDSPKEKIHERTFDEPIIYMGCIFVKDSNLYYENLANEIKGDLKEQLKVYISNFN